MCLCILLRKLDRDVYKRQAVDAADVDASAPEDWEQPETDNANMHTARNILVNLFIINTSCLLYTSRCV